MHHHFKNTFSILQISDYSLAEERYVILIKTIYTDDLFFA
jgi:hypothetical protein